MNKINQKHIAVWLGVSEQLICDIKKSRRTFGKKNAFRISELTGIPYRELTLENGVSMIKKLYFAYQQHGGQK